MFIADAHCDALYRMVTGGSPRSTTPETLKQGGVGVQALAMFAGEDEDRGFHRARPLCEALAAFGVPVLTGDMPKTLPTTPHAVATVEGGELFEGDLDKLRALDADVRVRMIALTWNFENELGFPAMGGSKNGLKPRGREFLAEMGRLRVLADVSHLNEAGFWDVCEFSLLPPVASHSDCRWLCDVPRNLTREQARAIFERKGYIGVNFCPEFLREDGRAVGLDRLAKIVGNGSNIGGTQMAYLGDEAREAMLNADLIISKGQANFETLIGAGLNVYYLFLAKCPHYTKWFGMEHMAGQLLHTRPTR